MMLDYRTDYEKNTRAMEHFVKPFMSRLVRRLDFSETERQRILETVESITAATLV
jgi:hypothetical protein